MNSSALAKIAASTTRFLLASPTSDSYSVPINPCSILPAIVVANKVGSCETKPIWVLNHFTFKSFKLTPSSSTVPPTGS